MSQKAVRRVLDRLEEPRHTSCPVYGTHRQTILDWHAERKSIKVISAQLAPEQLGALS